MADFANRLKSLTTGDGRMPILLTGFALTALIALISLFQPGFLQKADLFVYDQLLNSRALPPQSSDPVLVGIDEASLATYGQWPWPRYRLAMLVERLQAEGAKVIALDFLMPETDRTSPEVIHAERRRDQVEVPDGLEPNGTDSNSQRLAEAMGRGPSILGYFVDFEQAVPTTAKHAPPTIPEGLIVSRSAAY